jgi:hypothetical protein
MGEMAQSQRWRDMSRDAEFYGSTRWPTTQNNYPGVNTIGLTHLVIVSISVLCCGSLGNLVEPDRQQILRWSLASLPLRPPFARRLRPSAASLLSPSVENPTTTTSTTDSWRARSGGLRRASVLGRGCARGPVVWAGKRAEEHLREEAHLML